MTATWRRLARASRAEFISETSAPARYLEAGLVAQRIEERIPLQPASQGEHGSGRLVGDSALLIEPSPSVAFQTSVAA